MSARANPAAGGLTVEVGRRDFSGGLPAGGLAWTVERMTWRAVGGPWAATLRAEARGPEELFELLRLLRCPLVVRDALGPAWWGYIHAVQVQDGARALRVSLEEMANSVSVAYRAFSPTQPGGQGERLLTPWVSDAVSAAVYGAKQGLFSLGPGLPADAQAYAATLLAQHSVPRVAAAGMERPASGALARIECRGWWQTLDWQFYRDPRGRVGSDLSGVGQPLGQTASSSAAAQPIWLDAAQTCELGELWLRLRKTGSPADALRAEVRADSAGVPGGVMAACEVSGGAVGADWGWVRFAFDPPVELPASQTVWLALRRTGAPDAAHYYLCSADEGPSLPSWPVKLFDGAAWSARSPAANLSFIALGVEETTRQIARLLASPCGQFLAGARIEADSGVRSRVYRAGEERGGAEIERLLRVGTAAGARLLARIEADRTARVFPQPPAASATLQIDRQGEVVRADGRRLAPSEWPAGRWARLGELSAAGDLVGAGGVVWLEDCEWTENQHRRRIS